MGEVKFATDGNGKPLANPVSILVASTWDLTGEIDVYARDDATGAWTAEELAYSERIPGVRHLSQVRSFGSHRDRVTGIDYAFAGNDPHGVFSGVYDPAVPGRIRWSQTPELDISTISVAEFPGLAGRLRVTSFAECNDRLYATVGQQIYERIDGETPRWRLIYTNRNPGRSQSGLRGLTAVPSPNGQGQALLAAVEGTEPRIIRFDPRDGSDATDLDLHEFLSRAWGMDVGYTIAAYNNMTEVRDERGDDDFLIGLEAFIPRRSPVALGHKVFNIGRGRLEGAAWYLIRSFDGKYELRRIPAFSPQAMVATRSIVVSPFPTEKDAIYFGGFDANRTPVHNTGWIVRSTIEAAIGRSN
jgi:poly(A) polymerase